MAPFSLKMRHLKKEYTVSGGGASQVRQRHSPQKLGVRDRLRISSERLLEFRTVGRLPAAHGLVDGLLSVRLERAQTLDIGGGDANGDRCNPGSCFRLNGVCGRDFGDLFLVGVRTAALRRLWPPRGVLFLERGYDRLGRFNDRLRCRVLPWGLSIETFSPPG